MATKIIKALVNGVIQNIEVEDIISPELPLSPEERLDVLEDKHEVVFTEGNLLVGNGTEELEEMTPEEVLSHINGASVTTLTTSEYEALEETNANTLYMLTDSEEVSIYVDNDEPTNAEDGALWVDLDATSTASSSSESSVNLDATLTQSGYAADAKATGDALALKADKTDLESLSTLVGENAVSEQITTALESSGAVLYTEQTLTDEQRAQARENIAEHQYDWHEVAGYGGTYTLADFQPYYGGTSIDIDGAMNLTSAVLSQYSALGCLHGCVCELYGATDIESVVAKWMPRIIPDYEAISNAGLLSGSSMVICQKNIYDENIYVVYYVGSSSGEYTHKIIFSDVANGDIRSGTILYNNDTGAYSVTREVAHVTDETLSMHFSAADAKAVGEALALKADKTELVQSDWNQTDETALDYIKNKPEIATDDEIIDMLTQEDMIMAVADSDGAILADENSNILLW